MCRLSWITIAFAAFALSACTHTFDVPPTATASLNPAQQIGDAVALVVTPDLKAAQWSETQMGDTFEAPLGDALIDRSTQMLRSMFRNVDIVAAAGTDPKAVFYVTPTVQKIDRTVGSFAFAAQVFTIAVEWRVTDNAGRTLLIDTVIGEGRANTGNLFTYKGDASEALGKLLDDEFTKVRPKLIGAFRSA